MRFFAMLAASALVTCSSDPAAPIDTDITLSVGETASAAGGDISLKFLRVAQDSRCPLDVQCVWAGNAQLELEARISGQATAVALNTIDGPKEVVVSPYRISLVNLTPAPSSSSPISPAAYRARIHVTRPGGVCTEEARPALMVTVADSVLGGITNLTGVSVVARDGAYSDSVTAANSPGSPSNGPFALAYERVGTYTVTVRADGYSAWTRTAVVVTGDQCHVATVGVTARLARP